MFRKVAIGIAVVVVLGFVTLVVLTFVEIHYGRGGFVDVIDPEPYFDRYEVLGIRNVEVLTPDGDRFVRKNVVLEGATIRALDEPDLLRPGVDYLDGNGGYLIPGLIDTHVHLNASKNDLYLYLAWGVTGVFEMYGSDEIIGWKQEWQQGAASPALFVASRKIGHRGGLLPEVEDFFGNHVNLTSESDVRATVRRHRDKGYDALKLSSFMTLRTYRLILAEAERAGLPVLGHLAREIGLANLHGTRLAMLSHVEEIVKNTRWEFGDYYEQPARYLAYLDSRLDEIARRLSEDGTAVSTTIWLGESIARQKFDPDGFLRSIPLRYVNPGVAEGSDVHAGWLPGNNPYEDPWLADNPDARDQAMAAWDAYVEALRRTTRKLVEHDVVVLAGTDANVAGTVPGYSMHDELESLVASGLSNAQALAAATVLPAAFWQRQTGAIRPGYAAELVLLSADPLQRIGHTRRIERVFSNGFVLDQPAGERLLAAIENINARERAVDISRWQTQ